ncbi:MAG TPA: hypothetical protein VFH03_01155 [Actinoplanes sp.]|nr:hypothetical protein [Actinoplanes sp.]
MRASRLLGLLAAVATAVLTMPAPAQAEPYPAEPPASSVSEGQVTDGGTVTFRGEGFLPGETIAITISYNGSDSTAATRANSGRFVPAAMADLTVTASSAGTFSVTLKLTRVGTATLVATGLTSGVTVTQTVEVVASEDSDGAGGGEDDTTNAGGGNDRLPTTGSSGRLLFVSIYAGLGAILVGAGILWFTRSRRRSAG